MSEQSFQSGHNRGTASQETGWGLAEWRYVGAGAVGAAGDVSRRGGRQAPPVVVGRGRGGRSGGDPATTVVIVVSDVAGDLVESVVEVGVAGWRS